VDSGEEQQRQCLLARRAQDGNWITCPWLNFSRAARRICHELSVENLNLFYVHGRPLKLNNECVTIAEL
jgi:hypothetical protein